MRHLPIKLVATLVLLATPIATWALWKPIRVLAPELAGVKCFASRVCTDDPSKVAEASALRREAPFVCRTERWELQGKPAHNLLHYSAVRPLFRLHG